MKQQYKTPPRIMCFSTGSSRAQSLCRSPGVPAAGLELRSAIWLGRLSEEGVPGWALGASRRQAAVLLPRGWARWLGRSGEW